MNPVKITVPYEEMKIQLNIIDSYLEKTIYGRSKFNAVIIMTSVKKLKKLINEIEYNLQEN